MLGEVIEKAACLAETGEPTVDRALTEYQRIEEPGGLRLRQVWVSVAFLLKRHATIVSGLGSSEK